MIRHDSRTPKELREVTIETNVFKHPEGSMVISFGDTKVICSATVEEKVPPFLRGAGIGWVAAEHSVLLRVTNTRDTRESAKGKLTGRTMEIQRLIGRSLRTVIDLEKLEEWNIVVDCDVIQADGGTRIASIIGAFAALRLAVNHLLMTGALAEDPIEEHLAAISVGILLDGYCMLDLDYTEDSNAVVDMNIVATESGEFVEIRGTGEEIIFSGDELDAMFFYGKTGIEELIAYQKEALYALASEEISSQDSEEEVIVIATRNPDKAEEFSSILGEKGYAVKTLLGYPNLLDVEETSRTFEESARLKAGTITGTLQKPVLVGDSGLIADALGGVSGIYSARFAGEPTNDASSNAKLLHKLMDVSEEKGQARFHYTLVSAELEKESLVVGAEWSGKVDTIPHDEEGFGYDPLFYAPESGKAATELSGEERNKVSHRGQTVTKLKEQWGEWLKKWELKRMKILVISNNHGDHDCLVGLVDHHERQADAFFRCGDPELEPTDELWQKFIIV